MPTSTEVKGLTEIIDRMKRYPVELYKSMGITMTASLITLWQNVPSYPPPPEDSTYVRTGTLGKSLGSDIGGGSASGEPDIFKVRPLGSIGFEGTFGSRLDYAPYVIGDDTQATVHRGRWWVIRNIAERSAEKINQLWQDLGNKLAAFLDGKEGQV